MSEPSSPRQYQVPRLEERETVASFDSEQLSVSYLHSPDSLTPHHHALIPTASGLPSSHLRNPRSAFSPTTIDAFQRPHPLRALSDSSIHPSVTTPHSASSPRATQTEFDQTIGHHDVQNQPQSQLLYQPPHNQFQQTFPESSIRYQTSKTPANPTAHILDPIDTPQFGQQFTHRGQQSPTYNQQQRSQSNHPQHQSQHYHQQHEQHLSHRQPLHHGHLYQTSHHLHPIHQSLDLTQRHQVESSYPASEPYRGRSMVISGRDGDNNPVPSTLMPSLLIPSQPIKFKRTPTRVKSHVVSACVNCRRAHLSCEVDRPCARCVASGKQSTCIDVEHKKRGRPRLRRRNNGDQSAKGPQEEELKQSSSFFRSTTPGPYSAPLGNLGSIDWNPNLFNRDGGNEASRQKNPMAQRELSAQSPIPNASDRSSMFTAVPRSFEKDVKFKPVPLHLLTMSSTAPSMPSSTETSPTSAPPPLPSSYASAGYELGPHVGIAYLDMNFKIVKTNSSFKKFLTRAKETEPQVDKPLPDLGQLVQGPHALALFQFQNEIRRERLERDPDQLPPIDSNAAETAIGLMKDDSDIYRVTHGFNALTDTWNFIVEGGILVPFNVRMMIGKTSTHFVVLILTPISENFCRDTLKPQQPVSTAAIPGSLPYEQGSLMRALDYQRDRAIGYRVEGDDLVSASSDSATSGHGALPQMTPGEVRQSRNDRACAGESVSTGEQFHNPLLQPMQHLPARTRACDEPMFRITSSASGDSNFSALSISARQSALDTEQSRIEGSGLGPAHSTKPPLAIATSQLPPTPSTGLPTILDSATQRESDMKHFYKQSHHARTSGQNENIYQQQSQQAFQIQQNSRLKQIHPRTRGAQGNRLSMLSPISIPLVQCESILATPEGSGSSSRSRSSSLHHLLLQPNPNQLLSAGTKSVPATASLPPIQTDLKQRQLVHSSLPSLPTVWPLWRGQQQIDEQNQQYYGQQNVQEQCSQKQTQEQHQQTFSEYSKDQKKSKDFDELKTFQDAQRQARSDQETQTQPPTLVELKRLQYEEYEPSDSYQQHVTNKSIPGTSSKKIKSSSMIEEVERVGGGIPRSADVQPGKHVSWGQRKKHNAGIAVADANGTGSGNDRIGPGSVSDDGHQDYVGGGVGEIIGSFLTCEKEMGAQSLTSLEAVATIPKSTLLGVDNFQPQSWISAKTARSRALEIRAGQPSQSGRYPGGDSVVGEIMGRIISMMESSVQPVRKRSLSDDDRATFCYEGKGSDAPESRVGDDKFTLHSPAVDRPKWGLNSEQVDRSLASTDKKGNMEQRREWVTREERNDNKNVVQQKNQDTQEAQSRQFKRRRLDIGEMLG